MNENEKSKTRPGVVKRPNGAGYVCVRCDKGAEIWVPAGRAIVFTGPTGVVLRCDGMEWQVYLSAGSSDGDFCRNLAESIAQELEAARG